MLRIDYGPSGSAELRRQKVRAPWWASSSKARSSMIPEVIASCEPACAGAHLVGRPRPRLARMFVAM